MMVWRAEGWRDLRWLPTLQLENVSYFPNILRAACGFVKHLVKQTVKRSKERAGERRQGAEEGRLLLLLLLCVCVCVCVCARAREKNRGERSSQIEPSGEILMMAGVSLHWWDSAHVLNARKLPAHDGHGEKIVRTGVLFWGFSALHGLSF